MAESIVSGVYASIIATLIPSSLLLTLRFYARRLKRVSLWWDDYLAVLSLAAAVAYDISAFFLITKGLGLHLDDLPVSVGEARFYQAMVQEIEEHTYTIAVGAAQLSLLALYWRLFKSISSARFTIFILTGCASVWVIVRLFVAIFQCFPPHFFWDKSIDGKCTVDPAKFFLWSVSAHLLVDVALMALPASQISRLLLPWPQKTAIAAMFMFGIAVVVASIMMLVASSRYDSYAADTMWNCTPAVIWSAVEIHLSVMACCLPVMRPVVHAFGGWWGQNFTSRRSAGSAPSRQSVKLGHVHRSTGHTDGESTYNLASMAESNNTNNNNNNTTTLVESGRIYGQGDGVDTTVASTGKAKEKLDRDGAMGSTASTRNNDRAILVQYEVNLSFSRQDSRDK
ncbi:hypothetical protein QQS21_002154 [Conoideocrella luteorostrata]|uniref:Rhodopsin domain-containing protein n=1 Tax=Conoideocrella luteorostrata TaxID=1105319 RepID=A0AAJ0CYX6_9HYPO|nr:hypothetical protein QQS21_002154 [Conoideocrella luteorostrata]